MHPRDCAVLCDNHGESTKNFLCICEYFLATLTLTDLDTWSRLISQARGHSTLYPQLPHSLYNPCVVL